MGSRKHLLLFAVLPLLVRGQQPQEAGSAKLSIETGRPVMWVGGAVILKLECGDLKGWRCWVSRDGGKPKMVQLNLQGADKSIAFQTADLNVPETTYWCTDKTRAQKSNKIILRTRVNWMDEGDGVNVVLLVGLVLGLVGLGAVLVGVLLVLRRKRTATEGVYEEVALSSHKQGDDKYEPLQKASGREREYDTLSPGASGSQAKSGEYEALKKEGLKEGVYHTLGAEGAAAGGEGGYEALKKEGMKEGDYHTLGVEGAAEGKGVRAESQ